MREAKQHENLFGSADAGFEERMHRTLVSIKQSEEEKKVKKFTFSMGLAIVLAIVLMSTAAYAVGKLGVVSFLNRYTTMDIDMDQVQELVVEDSGESVQTSEAVFRMRDAIFDGTSLYMSVEATPVKDDALLLGAMVTPEDLIKYMGPDFENMEGTIADWGAGIGRTRDVDINFTTPSMEEGNLGFDSWGGDMMLEADGTLVYMVLATLAEPQDVLELTLRCQSMNLEGENPLESRETADIQLRFEKKSESVNFEAVSTQAVDFEECGVRVDRVTLNASPMKTAFLIEYTVIDEEAFAKLDGGLTFEWIDEEGERLADGAFSGGSVSPLPGEGTAQRFVQNDATMVMTRVPDTLTLRAFNCWDKTRYEAHEITFEEKAEK